MQTIERAIASITEDHRADYLWETKRAAHAVNCVPRKFPEWWKRTESKLIDLFCAMPGPTAAMLALLLAKAQQELEARERKP